MVKNYQIPINYILLYKKKKIIYNKYDSYHKYSWSSSPTLSTMANYNNDINDNLDDDYNEFDINNENNNICNNFMMQKILLMIQN